MREEKDRSGKWLLTHHGDSLLRLAGMKTLRMAAWPRRNTFAASGTRWLFGGISRR
jgi:hypothetical protein